MAIRRQYRSLAVLGVTALLAGLLLTGSSQAQNAPKPPPPKKAPPKETPKTDPKAKAEPKKQPAKAAVAHPAKKADPKIGLKFEEEQALRKAYLLLAEANHDYNGHRVRAMNAVHAAGKILNADLMRNGDAQVKKATIVEDVATARTAAAVRTLPTVHENQRISDAQLREAALLIKEVHSALIKNKQHTPGAHLETALRELRTALEIR